MNKDFHYFATCSAAYFAGYSFEESIRIAHADFFVDLCTENFLSSVGGPKSAATTQHAAELASADTSMMGLHDITRIWASFHFLPQDLYAERKIRSRRYMHKYRLICGPNGELVKRTVELAKDKSLEAVGLAMHVLADTWAHRYFAGTPSLVINNTTDYFYEEIDGERRQIRFKRGLGADDPEKSVYVSSIYQGSESSIMNLGHGRAGHLPDYSFIKYIYLPAWGDYAELRKDNPSDFMNAYAQVVYALKFLHGDVDEFELEKYAFEDIEEHRETIENIIGKRQIDSSGDWKAFAESLFGQEIPDPDFEDFKKEFKDASEEEKRDSFLGRFFLASLAQKSMVTNAIYRSNNPLAGRSVEVKKRRFRGIRDFMYLVDYIRGGKTDE